MTTPSKGNRTEMARWLLHTENNRWYKIINVFFHFQSLLNRIPAYLTVQMVRFYYKEKDNVNAKILKVNRFCCFDFIIFFVMVAAQKMLVSKLEQIKNSGMYCEES